MKNDMSLDIVTAYVMQKSMGNPGAITFMMEAITVEPDNALKAFERMDYANIKGDKLYMIWNDCCDRDTKKALNVMLNNSIDDINKHINYENGRGIEYD